MKKSLAAIGTVVVILVAMVFGKLAGKGASDLFFGSSEPQFSDQLLLQVAHKVNERLPMMVDSETRLDKTAGGPGKKYTYYFTLVHYASSAIAAQQLKAKVAPVVKKKACANEKMGIFFRNGVVVSYDYLGNDGRHITHIDVLPSDCGYGS